METESGSLHIGFSKAEIQQAETKFAEGIQGILVRYPQIAQNFGLCIALIEGDPDASEQIRSMFAFATAYRKFGDLEIEKAIAATSGIHVPMWDKRGDFLTEGLVVGVKGVYETKSGQVLDGIGIVYENGRSVLVSVWIYPEGKTVIKGVLKRY